LAPPDLEQAAAPQAGAGDAGQGGDWAHMQLAAQHFNIGRLGRDTGFGNWAISNGEFRSLLQPGQVPFDYLEDAT